MERSQMTYIDKIRAERNVTDTVSSSFRDVVDDTNCSRQSL